jgi:hypothetical protein
MSVRFQLTPAPIRRGKYAILGWLLEVCADGGFHDAALHLFRRSVVGSGSGGSSGARPQNRTTTEGTEASADLHFTATLSDGFFVQTHSRRLTRESMGWRYQQKGTYALFRHPVIKFKKVNEENRNSDR